MVKSGRCDILEGYGVGRKEMNNKQYSNIGMDGGSFKSERSSGKCQVSTLKSSYISAFHNVCVLKVQWFIIHQKTNCLVLR